MRKALAAFVGLVLLLAHVRVHGAQGGPPVRINAPAGPVRPSAILVGNLILGSLSGAVTPLPPSRILPAKAGSLSALAVVDQKKLLLFLERARSAESGSTPLETLAPSGEPSRILTVVDKVLKEVSAEDLRRMPPEALEGFARRMMGELEGLGSASAEGSRLARGPPEPVLGPDLLFDAQHMFFDETMHSRRFGVEIEFGSRDDAAVVRLIKEKLGARETGRLPSGEVLFESPYGPVALKIEGQAWRHEEDPVRYQEQLEIDRVSAPREIVLPPMTYKDIGAIQALTEALQSAGMTGTGPGEAVSTQVNVEMPSLLESPRNVANLVNLLRVYSWPAHFQQIRARIRPPEIRHEYLGELSPGFLRKLRDPFYNPGARELFDDYLYRQSLELQGRADAWTMGIDQARKALLSQPEPSEPRIVKMQRLRVSSLLLLAFPDDPLSRQIVADEWARPAPIVEFREFNTDFKTKDAVERALGLIRSVERFGFYDHDDLVSRLTGVSKADIGLIRQTRSERPILRYELEDPNSDSEELSQAPGSDVLRISLSPNRRGRQPLLIEGDSLIYHRRNIHRSTILGKRNPGLENSLIQTVMENKIFESKVFDRYAPGSLPRHMLLRDLIPEGEPEVPALLAKLKEAFPQGWVMKGAWDYGSEKSIVTDQTDVEGAIRDYREGFEDHRQKIERELRGQDPEWIFEELRKHPGYRGAKILEALASPDEVFFQERVPIAREFRVEVQGGKVLGRGSTLARYAYLGENQEEVSQEEIRDAEAFVQGVLERLPQALRLLPYGFDAAHLEDGRWVILESNAGGNSSFLHENKASSDALEDYLRALAGGVYRAIGLALSPHRQIRWIGAHIRAFQLDPARHFEGLQFTRDDILDPDYP